MQLSVSQHVMYRLVAVFFTVPPRVVKWSLCQRGLELYFTTISIDREGRISSDYYSRHSNWQVNGILERVHLGASIEWILVFVGQIIYDMISCWFVFTLYILNNHSKTYILTFLTGFLSKLKKSVLLRFFHRYSLHINKIYGKKGKLNEKCQKFRYQEQYEYPHEPY